MAPSANQSQNVEQLRRYLRQQVDDGKIYFKSKYVAADLDMTAHEVGALFLKLTERETELEIEKWASSNGTTWRVTR